MLVVFVSTTTLYVPLYTSGGWITPGTSFPALQVAWLGLADESDTTIRLYSEK